MNGLITFFDIFISGVDGVEIEGRAAFLIDESLNCVLNFILRRFIFSVFFSTSGSYFFCNSMIEMVSEGRASILTQSKESGTKAFWGMWALIQSCMLTYVENSKQ